MLRRLLNLYAQNRCSTLAAAAAFYAFFSLIPIALLVLSIISFIIGTNETSIARAAKSFAALTPEGMESMQGTLRRLAQNRELVGLIGLAMGAIGGSALLINLRAGLADLFDHQNKRHFLLDRAWALLGTLALGAVLTLGAAAPLFVALRTIQKTLSQTALADIPYGVVVAQEALGAIAAAVIFGLVYRFFIPVKLRLLPLAVAAAACGVTWEICRRLFSLYIQHTLSGAIYGPLAGVFFVLAWLYVSFSVLFFGACYLRLTGVGGTVRLSP